MAHFMLCPFDSFTYRESIKQSTYFYIIERGKKKAGYTRRNLSFESNQGHDGDGKRGGILCVQIHN
jgi:hypothetical protein